MNKCVDGKIIEMTEEEVTERENQIKEDVAMLKALEDAQTQKETDKANGKKKLKDLGLTDAEVDALIGG